MNKLSFQIQDHLIDINNIKNEIIKEFGVIYATFDALDNEYIKNITQSIMKSNEAINKANKGLIETEKRIEDIKEVNSKIQITQKNIEFIQEKLQVAQRDISRNVEITKKVVEGLSLFKAKIDSYKHLEDIDQIWNDLKSFEIYKEKLDNVESLINGIEKLEKLKRIVFILNISFGIILILLFFIGSK